MNGILSYTFEVNRSFKSVAPSKISDIELINPQLASLDEIRSCGFPILYAFDSELKHALVTFHENEKEILNSPFFLQGKIKSIKAVAQIENKYLSELFNVGDVKPIFLVSPGRVGSTLVSNIFKYGGVVCLSEPDALSSFKLNYFNSLGEMDQKKYENTFKETINSYGNMSQNSELILKLRSYSSSLVPLMEKSISSPKYIFLFRNISSWAISMLRTFGYTFGDLKWVFEQNIKALQLVKGNKSEYIILNYDALVDEPKKTINEIADFITPLVLNTKLAEQAMNNDSQIGTGIEKSSFVDKDYDEVEYNKFIDYWNQFDTQMIDTLGLSFLLR